MLVLIQELKDPYIHFLERALASGRELTQLEKSVLGFDYREPADEAGCLYPDNFIFRWRTPTKELLFDWLPRLAPGVTEVCVHPVEDGPELRAYDRTDAGVRSGDYACLFDEAVKAAVAREGVELIGFRPLRELQRAERKRA